MDSWKSRVIFLTEKTHTTIVAEKEEDYKPFSWWIEKKENVPLAWIHTTWYMLITNINKIELGQIFLKI